MPVFFKTKHGRIIHGDSLKWMRRLRAESVDLVVTSPPFGLVRKKEYGNVPADEYLDWFGDFATEIKRILKNTGSLVIDIGGAWNAGLPTRHLYHFKLLIMLCEEFGFHLAQDFYWWNPAKLPTPAEWVTVRRIRVKDAVNKIWWLSKTPWPKASNRRVLQPYSSSMLDLLENGYTPRLRPSGHDISDKFQINNGAAIPPNLIALPNTESNSSYLRYCKERGLNVHPARFPLELPEFFIRMLTDEGDRVIDPFAGSCVTGEVCERLKRNWGCAELREDYVKGALGRFIDPSYVNGSGKKRARVSRKSNGTVYYKLPRPGSLWDDATSEPLSVDGGRTRKQKSKTKKSPKKGCSNGSKQQPSQEPEKSEHKRSGEGPPDRLMEI